MNLKTKVKSIFRDRKSRIMTLSAFDMKHRMDCRTLPSRFESGKAFVVLLFVHRSTVAVEDANAEVCVDQVSGFAQRFRQRRVWGISFAVVILFVVAFVCARIAIGYMVRGHSRHDGEDNDVILRWKASNLEIPGLTISQEGSWKEPYFFVFGADTQLGLIDQMNNVTVNPSWDEELRRLGVIINHMNSMKPKPKFFIICGDLVNAYPERYPDRWKRQGNDLKNALLRLDVSIPVICVCGNHDIGNQPSSDAIAKYRGSFGDDYFSFWIQGSLFIVLNSQYYKDDSLVPDLSAAQELWLDTILSASNKSSPSFTSSPRHIVVFLHIAPFKYEEDEPDDYFNLAIEKRKPLLSKLFNAGVRKIFCGHFHRNAGGFAFDRRMEVIVNSAIGRVWAGKPGIRIVKVKEDDIKHEWFDLEKLPSSVEL